MTPERWQRMQALFLAAAERAPAERAALLEAGCGGDAELRGEVERMLAADEEPEPLLDAVPAVLAAAHEPAGRRVGPYRILRELGRGGMGTVYLAERDDVGKQVALKLVRGALAAPENLARFLLERRMLARLEHPNIAALLDAGVADDGTPYFAMEYVRGEPIDRYCDARRLSVRQRLELFLAVCAAVEYAHSRLVVHRDLKPSNILVQPGGARSEERGARERQPEAEERWSGGAGGRVKLLDFGIAKLLEEGAAVDGLTGTGMRLLTPEYAAPEQVRGEPVTTATDVYALGMVLYELLTGRRAYRVQGRAPGELERLVLEQDPARPSSTIRRAEELHRGDGTVETLTPEAVGAARGASPERLRRELAGDLDTILLKALEKQPEHRYPSVQQLGEELRRHLAGRPIAARPGTRSYRSRKFVRRHRWGVGAGAASVLVLLGFTALTTVQSRHVARERDKAEQVSGFLVELFSVSNPSVSRGEAVTARQFLDEGAARIDRELAEQPEVRATMLDAIGLAYRGLGLYDAARPPLDSALALRRRLHAGDHPDVAASLHNLGWLHRERGELTEAERLLRDALAMRRRLFGHAHPDVVRTTNMVALVLRDRGEFREAEQVYREALAIGSRVFRGPDVEMSLTYSGLGASLRGQGRDAESETFYRAALHTLRAAAGRGHPNEAINLGNLAQALESQGRLEEAEAHYREALEADRRVVGAEHPLYAMHLTNLANLLREKGEHPEVEAMYREVLAIQQRSLPAGHHRIANTLYGMGQVLLDTGKPGEAEPLLREALAIRQQQLSAGDWRTASTQSALGACLTALVRFGEAEPLLRDAHAALQRSRGEQDLGTRAARQRLVTLYEAWGRPEEARRWAGGSLRPEPASPQWMRARRGHDDPRSGGGEAAREPLPAAHRGGAAPDDLPPLPRRAARGG